MSWDSSGRVGAYKLVHNASGRYYIGSTADFDSRKSVHLSVLRSGRHYNQALQELFNGAPEVSFEFHETETRDKAYDIEQKFLDEGSSDVLMLNVSRDARKHTAKEVLSVTHRENISKALKGRTFDDDWVRKLSIAATVRLASDDTKSKMSAAQKGIKKTPQHIKAAASAMIETKGLKLSIDGIEYPTLTAASAALKLDARFIMRRVNSLRSEFKNWKRTSVENIKNILKREDDGISHLNIWSKARTELGQAASNFALTPFTHPDYGGFASIEALWYWLATGMQHSELRRLYGVSAKTAGKRLPRVEMDSEKFQSIIKEAIRLKFEQTPGLKKLLTESLLPFEHYFVYGHDNDVIRDQRPRHGWQTDYLEHLRDTWRVEAGLPKLNHVVVPETKPTDIETYVDENLIVDVLVAPDRPLVTDGEEDPTTPITIESPDLQTPQWLKIKGRWVKTHANRTAQEEQWVNRQPSRGQHDGIEINGFDD